MSKPAPAIGIDLGTSNSSVAVIWDGKVKVIQNEGNPVTPSYVAFTKHGCLIGEAAMNQIFRNPENTVFDVKRLIGRKFNDPTVPADQKHWPFTVQAVDEDPRIEVTCKGEKRLFTPELISAMVLNKLKELVEGYVQQTVINAVITVPVYFNTAQREATVRAGRIADLNVLQIINEPNAAAIAYAYAHQHHPFMKVARNVLVFHLGGGTFNATILTIDKQRIITKATTGDAHLGGDNFDCKLIEYCLQDLKVEHNRELVDNPRAMCRLRAACECAKLQLSRMTETKIRVDALIDDIDYSVMMTRTCFEELNAMDFKKLLRGVEAVLDNAKLAKADINKIVMVGGSTRIPKVQQLLREFFDGKELDQSMNSVKTIAYGAAIHAANLNRNESKAGGESNGDE